VLCNRRLKFDWLATRTEMLGCETLATGHYARILTGPDGRRRLCRGLDESKDQSYFVVPDSREQLDRLCFPLGDYAKVKIRAIAAERGLPVAEKPDSQDLCFVPRGALSTFLTRHIGEASPGEIVDVSGRVLGRHEGLHSYTIGQRKGLGISSTQPLHVVGKDVAGNRVILGPREKLFTLAFRVTGTVWLEPEAPSGILACSVKTRSTGGLTPCRVTPSGVMPDSGGAEVALESPQFAVTPGQLAVFYQDGQVLGAGWIEG
jgi:tRNA-specific 2-thiouridylase